MVRSVNKRQTLIMWKTENYTSLSISYKFPFLSVYPLIGVALYYN